MTDASVPYYPDWLAPGLLNGTLPWDAAQSTTMEQFLSTYTLHDSYWISLWAVPHQEAIAVIRWDSFWSRERVPFPGPMVAFWPILLIRFDRLYRITTTYSWWTLEYVDGGIAGAETRQVKDAADPIAQGIELQVSNSRVAEEQQSLVEWPIHATLILGHGDGIVQLLHDAKVDLLCLDRDGNVLMLHDL